jgi:hypothetical protein
MGAAMNWESINWESLARLRQTFLTGTAGATDYWQSETDVASYDATFAQRIGWKWDYVLLELRQRGWLPPEGELLDWACGSGIAGRAFLDHFGVGGISALHVADRSSLAVNFAVKRAREKFPRLNVQTGNGSPTVLLLSHVLTELDQAQTAELVEMARGAASVIWVEPGTYEASYTLVAVRETLRGEFNVVAPCTHSQRCGLLVPGNERHWCHHFAPPPPDIFQNAGWSRFAEETGIDLRDLPLSFLVLDKRPVKSAPAGVVRVIGHPRLYKPHALLLGCDESGVRDRQLTRRRLPAEFKRLKKRCAPLQIWECDDDEIVSAKPLEPTDSGSQESRRE